jgi:hypothetical protein
MNDLFIFVLKIRVKKYINAEFFYQMKGDPMSIIAREL